MCESDLFETILRTISQENESVSNIHNPSMHEE